MYCRRLKDFEKIQTSTVPSYDRRKFYFKVRNELANTLLLGKTKYSYWRFYKTGCPATNRDGPSVVPLSWSLTGFPGPSRPVPWQDFEIVPRQ